MGLLSWLLQVYYCNVILDGLLPISGPSDLESLSSYMGYMGMGSHLKKGLLDSNQKERK